MTTEKPLWETEFHSGYSVPEPIAAALLDKSWKNDVCPTFCRRGDPSRESIPTLTLWCDHLEPEEREDPFGKRFWITREIDSGASDVRVLLETDDAAKALAFMLAASFESPTTDAAKIAREFAVLLRRELSAEDMAETIRRNRTPEYAGAVCASHDFLDANEVMAEAFESVLAVELDLQDDAARALWGTAWDLAKRAEFQV